MLSTRSEVERTRSEVFGCEGKEVQVVVVGK